MKPGPAMSTLLTPAAARSSFSTSRVASARGFSPSGLASIIARLVLQSPFAGIARALEHRSDRVGRAELTRGIDQRRTNEIVGHHSEELLLFGALGFDSAGFAAAGLESDDEDFESDEADFESLDDSNRRRLTSSRQTISTSLDFESPPLLALSADDDDAPPSPFDRLAREILVLLSVLAVVRDVEAAPLEHEAGSGGDLARRDGAADRARELGLAARDRSEELLEVVSVGTRELVSWHR